MPPQHSYPPALHHSTAAIPPAAAQALVAGYLARATESPHLHPDALLGASGAAFSVHGREVGGLVLHQLRRVEAGLRGEVLAPEPAFEPEGPGELAGGDGRAVDGAGAGELAGGVEEGEVGRRGNAVADAGRETAVEVEEAGGKGESAVDREARKRAKKERGKLEKRDRAEALKKEKA